MTVIKGKIFWVMMALIGAFLFSGNGVAYARGPEPVKLIIDTDAGVDDMAALGWLLIQDRFDYELLGVTTVAGNTTVENAVNNVLTIMDAAGRSDIPVIVGASAPMAQPLSSTGILLHGPDGLWFSSVPHDQSGLSTDAAGFICAQAVAHPDAKLVTLGPLTNLASAVAICPADLAALKEIVVMGGSKTRKTPRADFNIWQDTEASDIVLNSGLPLTMALVEATEQVGLDGEALATVTSSSNPVLQVLAFPLQFYYSITVGSGGESAAPLYDLAAVAYAVEPRAAKQVEPALVKVVKEPGLAFGQSIIGSNFAEVVPMVASDAELSSLALRSLSEPGFDLETELFLIFSREPLNANVILQFRKSLMNRVLDSSLE